MRFRSAASVRSRCPASHFVGAPRFVHKRTSAHEQFADIRSRAPDVVCSAKGNSEQDDFEPTRETSCISGKLFDSRNVPTLAQSSVARANQLLIQLPRLRPVDPASCERNRDFIGEDAPFVKLTAPRTAWVVNCMPRRRASLRSRKGSVGICEALHASIW